jgi:hypothetical protein
LINELAIGVDMIRAGLVFLIKKKPFPEGDRFLD